MIEDTASAKAEGEALPAVTPTPAKAGFFSPVESLVSRVEAAIERWYAEHFHSAAVAGRAPIPAADKASLIKHVTAALPTDSKE